MSKSLFRRTLFPGVSVFALVVTTASAALAQESPASDSPAALPGTDPLLADAATDTGADVVVTGSRIRRPDFETPTPIVSLNAATIQASGTTNLTDFLSGYPALNGSFTSAANSGSDAGTGATGLNVLNLRKLGADRTLVLINGRRSVAGVPGSAAVDINTIPTDLVERVDILAGGASAVYGADAVSGVVNFIVRNDFQGISARAQAGTSTYGDGGKYFLSLTAGQNFAGGRGNLALSYQFSHESRLETRDRSYLSGENAVGFYNSPSATGYHRVVLNNVRYFDSSRLGGLDFNIDGVPEFTGDGRPWVAGQFIPDHFQQGGSGTLASDYGNDLLPQLDNHIANAFAHFDVSDKLTLFAEGKFARTDSFSLEQPTFDYSLYIAPDNPYIPANLQGMAAANGGFLLNRDHFDLGQRGERVRRETLRTVVGARGELSPALRYELSYVWGQTRVTSRYLGDQYSDRFLAALDAVRDPSTGQITCRANIVPGYSIFQPFARRQVNGSTFTPGECQPLNLFGEGNVTPEARQFIAASPIDRSLITQQVVSGSISGDTRDLFTLPGGPVGFAAGGEYRKETSRFTPDAAIAQGLTYASQLGAERGRYGVKEIFGELSLPLIRDRFIHRLEIDGAVRHSDYTTSGGSTTWNVEGQFAPVRDISFRGTLSQAVRAPNIGELFRTPSTTAMAVRDPCAPANINLGKASRPANCAALLGQYGANPATFRDFNSSNVAGTISGNLNLTPETARSWTAGVVLQPGFLSGLNVSFDWYRIKLKNAISTVSAQQLAELCVDGTTIQNQFCDAITRRNGGSQAGRITGFTIAPLNVAKYETRGLDMNLNYLLRTATAGTFNLRVVGNYLDRLDFIGTPGAPVTNNLQNTFAPKFQATADLAWQKGPVTLNYGISWFDKTRRFSEDAVKGDPQLVDPRYVFYRDYWQHDVYASLDVDPRFQLYGGVNNLTNRKPDIGENSYPQSPLGRYLFVGARVKTDRLF